jgi:hypothetical protein
LIPVRPLAHGTPTREDRPWTQPQCNKLFVTSREFVVPTAGQNRRYPRRDDLNLRFNWRNDRGRMIAEYQNSERADTIYSVDSGVELQAIGTALRQLIRASADTGSRAP